MAILAMTPHGQDARAWSFYIFVPLAEKSLRSLTESVLAAALTKTNVRSTLECVRLDAALG